jgi:hypothetical protein
MRPWEQFTNQEQWKEYLQNLLRTNKKALYRAIVLIADYQTPEERARGTTMDHNGVGFGIVDAEMMTALAVRIKNGGELTRKELCICRNKMPKYWKQLMKISKRRMEDEKQNKTHDEEAMVPGGHSSVDSLGGEPGSNPGGGNGSGIPDRETGGPGEQSVCGSGSTG